MSWLSFSGTWLNAHSYSGTAWRNQSNMEESMKKANQNKNNMKESKKKAKAKAFKWIKWQNVWMQSWQKYPSDGPED